MFNTNITTIHTNNPYAAIIDLLDGANFMVEQYDVSNEFPHVKFTYWLENGMYAHVTEIEPHQVREYGNRKYFNSGYYRIVSEVMRGDEMEELETLYFVEIHEDDEESNAA